MASRGIWSSVAVPEIAGAAAAGTLETPSANAPWRTFEVTTEVEIWPQDVPAKLWLPLALYGDTDYQRALGVRWTGNAATTGIYRDPRCSAAALQSECRSHATGLTAKCFARRA